MKKLIILFLAGLFLTGCGEAESFSVKPLEKAGFEIEETTVEIEGLSKEYNLIYISDTHIITDSDEVTDKDMVAFRKSGLVSEKDKKDGEAIFEKFSKVVDKCGADGILMGADMIDFCSLSNVETLRKDFENIKTRFMYIRSDHDSLPFNCENLTVEKAREYQDSLGEYNAVTVQDYDEFLVVGINDNYNQITAEALSDFKKVLEEKKPVILLIHVPINSLVSKELYDVSVAVWKDALIWGDDCHYVPDENTKEFIELVLNENSPVKAVYSGHIHTTFEGYLTEKIKGHVFSAGYNYAAGHILVKPW